MPELVIACPACVAGHTCGTCGAPTGQPCATQPGPFWMHTTRTENAHNADHQPKTVRYLDENWNEIPDA